MQRSGRHWIALLLASALVLLGCESNNLYANTKVGATAAETGSVELYVYSCKGGPIRTITLGTRESSTSDTGPTIWRAEHEGASSHPGLDVLSLEGDVPGWRVTTPLDEAELDSASRLVAELRFQSGARQWLTFTLDDLRPGRLRVTPSSFGGKSHVTTERFQEKNEKNCDLAS